MAPLLGLLEPLPHYQMGLQEKSQAAAIIKKSKKLTSLKIKALYFSNDEAINELIIFFLISIKKGF